MIFLDRYTPAKNQHAETQRNGWGTRACSGPFRLTVGLSNKDSFIFSRGSRGEQRVDTTIHAQGDSRDRKNVTASNLRQPCSSGGRQQQERLTCFWDVAYDNSHERGSVFLCDSHGASVCQVPTPLQWRRDEWMPWQSWKNLQTGWAKWGNDYMYRRPDASLYIKPGDYFGLFRC